MTVTPAALDRLSEKMTDKKTASGMALRMTRKQGGWRLRVDHSKPADEIISHQGRVVLLLDEMVALAMKSMTLDVRTTDAGPRLTLH